MLESLFAILLGFLASFGIIDDPQMVFDKSEATETVIPDNDPPFPPPDPNAGPFGEPNG